MIASCSSNTHSQEVAGIPGESRSCLRAERKSMQAHIYQQEKESLNQPGNLAKVHLRSCASLGQVSVPVASKAEPPLGCSEIWNAARTA
jgi:hypothetical protein